MVLEREITTRLGSSTIYIQDTIRNEGFQNTPFMLLYHCNFGFPLVDSASRFLVDTPTVKPRDLRAQEGVRVWNKLHGPEHGFTEQLYYLDVQKDETGYACAVIENPNLLKNGLRMTLRYNKETLPYCSEWKQLGEGDYVLGIEPGTWLPEGRAKARAGEEYVTDLSFTVEEL